MNVYSPGDRVRSRLPSGDTGNIIEQIDATRVRILWDSNTVDDYPIGLILPMSDLVSVPSAIGQETKR